MEVKSETLLTGYSEHEKAAYLGVLAALATADRKADPEELEHLREVAHAAGISEEEARNIMEAAQDTSGQNLKQCLDALKNSNLRYGLLTDLITLAKIDEGYTDAEKTNIQKVAQYLNVNPNQFAAIDQLATSVTKAPQDPEQLESSGFLQSSGIQQKLSNAGIDVGAMGKSIFGFLTPMLLGALGGKMLGGARKGAGGLGGLAGGVLGGMLGGGTNTSGGLGIPGGLGGLGSLVSGLSKSRSNQSMGDLLGKIFK